MPLTAERTEGRVATWSVALLLGVVALAFADASIVVLGLADIYGELDVGIVAVSWVITGYAAAVAVVAGVLVVGRRPAPTAGLRVGLLLFAAGSIGSATASSIGVLIGARAVQGVGAALVLAAALPVLTVAGPDEAWGRRWWSRAGALGAVLGPAVGGLLTQVFDWRSIFWVQAPVALAALVAVRSSTRRGSLDDAAVDVADESADREADVRDPHERDPHEEALGSATVLANVAFGLLFAAAVGALFLTVLCAIEVWRFEPLAGAAVVSALPVATLAVHPLAVRLGGRQRLAVGVVTLVAGLAGLALLIGSAPLWMALSMAACGAGFGCVAEALGPHALGRGTARAGSFTTAARHAGLVLGLVVTAPVLAGSLDTGAEDAAAQGVAVVLDAPLDLGVKLGLVDELRTIVLETPAGEVPDVEPVFASAAAEASPTVAEELDDVEDDLVVAIERALTRAFRSSFLVAAAFAAALAVPGLAALARSRRTSTAPEPVTGGRSGAALGAGALCCVAVALVAAAVGRDAVSVGRYEPADPCSTGGLAGVSLLDGPDVVVQAVGLDALANAACELGTTREWLVLALDPETALGPARGIPDDDIAEALRTGVDTSLTNAEEEGTLPAIVVGIAREALAEVDIVEWIENPTLPDLSG